MSKDKPYKKPFISVAMPTYNRVDYIGEAIGSALSQDYAHFEVVIIDDGSTDDTESLISGIKSERLRYIRKEHTGAPDTRNRSVDEAKGEFILWLDSDDVLMPGVISAYIGVLAEYPDADVIYGDLLVIDSQGHAQQELKYGEFYKNNSEILAAMLFYNPIPNPGTMLRKSVYQRFGGYDLSFRRSHDYEFWTRVANKITLKHAGRFVCKWRWHDKNTSSGSVRLDTSFEARVVMKILERYSLKEIFPKLDWKNDINVSATAYQSIGSVFERWRDYTSAVEYYKKSREVLKTVAAYGGLGRSYYHLRDYRSAREAFENAFKIDPNYGEDKAYLTKLSKIEKGEHEMAFWKERKKAEGTLGNGHYEYFFTKHFGLDHSFFKGKRILDIGCGPRGSLEWANMAALRVGLDPLAASYLELGTGTHKMQYVASESESIPFPDGSFDVVSSFNSLDHVNNLAETIGEIKRVLKPGGLFLLLSEVNHRPTKTEPLTFSWDIVNQFTDSMELVEVGHYEKNESGMYDSMLESTTYNHFDRSERSGILSARFKKEMDGFDNRIKVLFISHSPDMAGAEQCLLNIIKHLDRERFRPFAVFPFDGPLRGEMERMNVRTFLSPIDWWIYPASLHGEQHWRQITTHLFMQADPIVKIIEREGIDVVHTNTSVIWAGALAARIAGIPHLWQLHEILEGHPSLQPYHELPTVYFLMNDLSDRIAVVSRVIKERLMSYISSDKIILVPNGIDIEKFQTSSDNGLPGIREEVGLKKDDLLVGTVGNIVREKGYDVLIEAAKIIYERTDKVHFVIAGAEGEKDLAEELKKRVVDGGLAGRVHFLGYRNDIPDILKGIDLYVNSSFTEASPLSVIEAMAAGKPVVASRCGGMSDVVADGETGCLVEPGNPNQLAKALYDLLTNGDQRRLFGTSGAIRVRKLFNIRNNVSLLEQQYADLVQKGEKRGVRSPDPLFRILSDVISSIEKELHAQHELLRSQQEQVRLQQEQVRSQQEQIKLQQEQILQLKIFVDGVKRLWFYKMFNWIRKLGR